MGGATFLSVVSQLVLGWLLSDGDFGVYALAISAAALVQSMKDGGVQMILERVTASELRRQANTALVISGLMSLLTTAIIIGFAGPVADLFGEPDVAKLLVIIAISGPIGFVEPVALGGLHAGMRFRTASLFELASATIRHGLTIAFAIAGLGPFSFVLPLLFVKAFESIAGWIALRRTGLTPDPGFCPPGELLRLSPWAILGAWATFAYLAVDNLVLGRLVSTAAVGLYYFAYQIVFKLLSLFIGLRGVAVPGFAALGEDKARTERAVEAASLLAGGIAAPSFMMMAVTAAPLVGLVWQGRWDGSVGSIVALALAMPAFLLLNFVEMLIQSRGRFGFWAFLVAARGAVVGSAAWVGSSFVTGDIPTPAAVVIAVAIAIGSLLLAYFVARGVSVGPAALYRGFVPPWILSLAIAGIVLAAKPMYGDFPNLVQLALVSVAALAALHVGFRWVLVNTAEAMRPLLGLVPAGRILAAALGIRLNQDR
jgi:PST family polysaccharide transporter